MTKYKNFNAANAPATSIFDLKIDESNVKLFNVTSLTSKQVIVTTPLGFEIRIIGDNLSGTVMNGPNGPFLMTGGTISAVSTTNTGGTIIYESITDVPNVGFARPANDDFSLLFKAAFAGDDTLEGGSIDDILLASTGNDTIDGGSGSDTVRFSGNKSDYTIVKGTDGSYLVTDRIAGRDGLDNLKNVEKFQFLDQAFDAGPTPSLPALFNTNQDAAKGLAAAYEVLLAGIPNIAGFSFLINSAVSSNFGAGIGPVFNQENIFINLVNNLVQGNVDAKGRFDSLAIGGTLQEKVTSLYKTLIPTSKQTTDGLAFFTRPEGIKFYQDVAAERGVAGTDGAAIVSLAAILKIAVTGDFGVGNAVNDLFKAVVAGSAAIPASGTALTAIETADGTTLDADDTVARAVTPEANDTSEPYSSSSDLSDVTFSHSVSIIGVSFDQGQAEAF